MIKSLKAVNLNRHMTFDLQFHEDINILTGKNGSGKTTLLKLLWYAISGNLERILQEITFDSFELETDTCKVGMTIEVKHKRRIFKLKYRIDGLEKEAERPIERGMNSEELHEANRLIARGTGSSIFFPTFRRIEGGFSISPRMDDDNINFIGGRTIRQGERYYSGEFVELQQAVYHLSDRLSVAQHRFVASISTEDIIRLLTSKYSEVSEKTNRLHMDLSRYILDRVGGSHEPTVNGGGTVDSRESREALNDIRQRARNVTQQSEALLRPFTVLSDLTARVLQYKGIKFTKPFTLGEASEAIASDVLSAGEKQMLSFLCYNAFASKSCLFIDEPEISLHVDWQRILFPLLLQQSTGNQFIVATHSPFIYSKYSDKELMLIPDRGDADAYAQNDGSGDHQLLGENVPANAAGRG